MFPNCESYRLSFETVTKTAADGVGQLEMKDLGPKALNAVSVSTSVSNSFSFARETNMGVGFVLPRMAKPEPAGYMTRVFIHFDAASDF